MLVRVSATAKFGLISWGTLTSYCALTHPCSCAQLTKCFQHTLLQGHVHSSALAQPSHSMLVRVSATHLPSLGSSAGVPLPHSRAQLTKCFVQGHVHSLVCHPPAKFGLISWGTLTSYCPLTHPCSRAQLTKCFQHTLLQGHVHSSALAQPSHSMLVRVSATHLPSLGSSAGVPLPHTVP